MQDTLNVNNMNVNPRNNQRRLRNTVVPLNNPDNVPGKEDMCRQVQKMCFPDDHPNLELRGKLKGIKVVLQERKSIWDKYIKLCKECGIKVVRKYKSCTKLQTYKDIEHRIMLAEAVGQGDAPSVEDVIGADSETLPTLDDDMDKWCCMQHVSWSGYRVFQSVVFWDF